MSDYDDFPAPPASRDLATHAHFMPLKEDSFKILDEFNHIALRDTAFADLTDGAIGVRMIRRVPGTEDMGSPWHSHEWTGQIAYIVRGWGRFHFDGVGEVRLEAGTFAYQPRNNIHREIELSDDFESIEITLPAVTETTFYIPGDRAGEWDVHTLAM